MPVLWIMVALYALTGLFYIGIKVLESRNRLRREDRLLLEDEGR